MNLLIVDDQPSVLASLLSMINWQAIGISDVYAASSALKAKEILQSKKIHILVTDIEMPVESGLCLVRWVREQNFNIECILLTSHADFFYAKQAINLDVFEYILQPAKKEDILQAVENAKLRLNKKIEIENVAKLNETNSTLQNTVIRHMFEQCPKLSLPHISHSELEKTLKNICDLGITCTLDMHVVFLGVCVTRWFTLPLSPSEMLLRYQNQLSNFFQLIGGHSLSYWTRQNCFISAIFSDNVQEIESYLYIFQKKMNEALQIDTQIYYCVSEFYKSAETIGTLYSYLEDALANPYTTSDTPLIHVSLTSDNSVFSKTSVSVKNYYSQIEHYIDQNISAPITRTQIAEHLHLSPDYVSRIVRITTGGACKELIVHKKMSHARQLLRTTNLPIGEIAAQCGYDNFAYFSRVYKSYYNVVPSSERN